MKFRETSAERENSLNVKRENSLNVKLAKCAHYFLKQAKLWTRRFLLCLLMGLLAEQSQPSDGHPIGWPTWVAFLFVVLAVLPHLVV